METYRFLSTLNITSAICNPRIYIHLYFLRGGWLCLPHDKNNHGFNFCELTGPGAHYMIVSIYYPVFVREYGEAPGQGFCKWLPVTMEEIEHEAHDRENRSAQTAIEDFKKMDTDFWETVIQEEDKAHSAPEAVSTLQEKVDHLARQHQSLKDQLNQFAKLLAEATARIKNLEIGPEPHI